MRSTIFSNTLFKQLGIVAVAVVVVGGFALGPVYGQAQTTTSTITVPYNPTFQICPFEGDLVQVSGDQMFVFHTMLNPDGTSSLVVNHVNSGALTGTTQSGEPVLVTEVASSIQNLRTSGTSGVFHTTYHSTFAINGQPNIVVIYAFTTIINEDGTTKIDVGHPTTVRCLGA